MRACHMEHEDTIQFLCEKGSTALRIKNSTGQTCMDLASQSLNPLIAKLLEKKYLESLESTDELQFGGRRKNYNTNNCNKIVENQAFTSVLLRNKANSTKNQEKRIFVNLNDTEETLGCKYHCQQDKPCYRYVHAFILSLIVNSMKICSFIISLFINKTIILQRSSLAC